MLDIKITNAKTRKTGKELVEIGIENARYIHWKWQVRTL